MSEHVPSGYKQTKVGVIPEDWDVVKLGDMFDFIKTYSNSRSHLSDVGDIEYMHYGDIHTKYKFHIDLNKVTLPKISQDNIKGDIAYVQKGDLIIADASVLVPEPFGQPAGVDVDSAPVYMWTLRRSTYGQLSL